MQARTPAGRIPRVPPIAVAVLLSLLLHAALLWAWRPDLPLRMSEPAETGEFRMPLRAQLRRPSIPASGGAQAVPAQPAEAADRTQRARAFPPEKPAARKPRPPVMALNTRTRVPPVSAPVVAAPAPPVVTPAPPSPAAPRPPAQGDMFAMLEERRRARGETPRPSAAESEEARRERIVASNLGQDARSLSIDPRQGGGVFQLRHLANDYAQFQFYGWNKDIKRNSTQLIEVRRGDHPDIRLAVVRRMIAIIREHEQGDFEWESNRLRRTITLSARREDNAGLEDFMKREFFSGG